MKTCSQRIRAQWLPVVVLLTSLTSYLVLSAIFTSLSNGGKDRHLDASSARWVLMNAQTIIDPRTAMAQSLVEGKGKVIAVIPEKQQIVLSHEEIKGFMEAMTMGYRVNPISLLNDLKPGDDVRFSIDPKLSTIVKISKSEK